MNKSPSPVADLFGVHLISVAKDADIAIKATIDISRDTAGGNISDQGEGLRGMAGVSHTPPKYSEKDLRN
jgi:hypothetical protein